MGRIFDYIAYKCFKDKDTEHPLAIDFYTMQRHFTKGSTNIAVIQNKARFRYVVKSFEKRVVKKRGDMEIKVSEDKYIFIIDEIETAIVRLNELNELEDTNLKFGKFM